MDKIVVSVAGNSKQAEDISLLVSNLILEVSKLYRGKGSIMVALLLSMWLLTTVLWLTLVAGSLLVE